MDTNQDPPSRSPLQPASGLPSLRTSCDLCKRMKIKCDRQGKSCENCIGRGSKCETTSVERKKRQGSRLPSLLDMEGRIKRMESVIKASGLDAQSGAVTEGSKADTPAPDPIKLSDRLSTLVINGEGNSRFFGASSGFSLFSPQGIQWISERTGNNVLPPFASSLASAMESAMPQNSAELWHTMLPSEREPLPQKEIADYYIQYFFNTFNNIFPLYDRAAFIKNYDLQYSGNPPTGLAWYASLNIVICLGGMASQACSQSERDKFFDGHIDFAEEQHWKCFRNACSCFVDLMFNDCSLLAVQAICGIAFVQQLSLDPRSVYILTATAGRLAYGIGLHRKLDDCRLSQAEVDQRRNVFWIVYFIDKSVTLRLGYPSVMIDEDIGVDLPQEIYAIEKHTDGWYRYPIFRWHTQLAILESRIYTELYSIRSQSRSPLERLRSVCQLDKELLEWKNALPVEIQPDQVIHCAEEQFLPIASMHFGYFNCLMTIHRVSINHGSWISSHLSQGESTLRDQQLTTRVYASQSICLAAARCSIQLLRSIPNGVTWILMYYPLSGFLTLFANCLQNPRDSQVASDLKLMEFVTSCFSPMMVHVSPLAATTSIIFRELLDLATRFVDKTTAESLPHQSLISETPVSMVSSTSPQYRNQSPATHLSDLSTTRNFPQQDSNIQQHYPEPLNPFGSDDPVTSNQYLLSNFDMREPPPFNTPICPEYFELDLANLWNLDFTHKG